MMEKHYSVERGQQILVSLLKQHNIRKIIASPGTTNITFVASCMADPFFEIYSAPDERSGAYIATGMAAETGEAVVLTCTGATASRNYLPAITEAYYRKLPILAVTATQNVNKIGHLVPQVIDRSVQIKDTYVHCETVSVPKDKDDEWDATIKINRCLLALRHHGGGPVHLNLATNYCRDFSVTELPDARLIKRYEIGQNLPDIPQGRVAIRLGSHLPMSPRLTESIDKFCEKYGAVVFCEFGSNYAGKFRVDNALLSYQCNGKDSLKSDLIIHIGDTASYGNDSTAHTKEVWRVSEDGELRDLMRKLVSVFEMPEEYFFTAYSNMDDIYSQSRPRDWYHICNEAYDEIQKDLLSKDIPFSNVWIAQQTANRIPENSALHVGILHSQRTWSMFKVHHSIQNRCFVNTGGFGIDGCMSAAIGGALAIPNKLHFLFIGDLAFFYDMNSLGNRHIGPNLRVMLINNGRGTEFRNYNHPAAAFGDSADPYMAAAHHYGDQSRSLVKHYAEDLGYEYLSASNKDDYLSKVERFLTPKITEKPMLMEVFTDYVDESKAIEIANTLIAPATPTMRQRVRAHIPDSVVYVTKKMLGK